MLQGVDDPVAETVHDPKPSGKRATQSQRDHVRLANLWQYLFATRSLIQPVNLNQRHTGGAIHAAHNRRVVAWR